MFVEGSLIAVGDDENRISFTSRSIEPEPGIWGTIRYTENGQGSLLLKYCDIEYATNGLTIEDSSNENIF